MSSLKDMLTLHDRYEDAFASYCDALYMGTQKDIDRTLSLVESTKDNIAACLGLTPGQLKKTIETLRGL